MVTQYCLFCHKPYTISTYNKNYTQFCSKDCLTNYIATHKCKTAHCLYCHQEYIPNHSNQAFCSIYCKRHYTKQQHMYKHICKCCNTLFTSHYSEGNFCSRACATTYTSRFHNMGYVINNESEWSKLNHSILPVQYELPSAVTNHDDYFAGYYMDIHHEVRSGTEHNICRLLQLCNIAYDYELYTFKLSTGKTYRPDIYIPSEDIFYEIKGEWRGDAYDKVQRFQYEYPSIKLIIINMNIYSNIEKTMNILFPHINFNKHIRVTNHLVRHMPQFRNEFNYDIEELQYWFFTNQVDISLLDNPITLTKELEKLIKPYRLTGRVYYAIYNEQIYYNANDINQIKAKLKTNTQIMIPNTIQKFL